jgi:hypothetical protein
MAATAAAVFDEPPLAVVAGALVDDGLGVVVVDAGALVVGVVVGMVVGAGVVTGGVVGVAVVDGEPVVVEVVVVCASARTAANATQRPSRAVTMTTAIALRATGLTGWRMGRRAS